METINELPDRELAKLEMITRDALKKSYFYLGKDAFRLCKEGGKRTPIIQSILLVSENLVEPCGINGRLLSLGEFEEIRCWNAKNKRLWVEIKTDNGKIKWEMYE